MSKVSFIVPVYNTEKYLSQCLDSLIHQTLHDIEIVCVNDGSTDKSGDILNAYAQMDSRIIIINQKISGLSAARNAGLEKATGKYVQFVDSDDCFSTNAAQILFDQAEKTESDVVIYDWFQGTENYQNIIGMTVPQFRGEYVKKTFSAESMSAETFKFWPVSSCFKFYNLDFINKNHIRFAEGIIYEDLPFWAEIYTKAQKISYIPLAFYYYRTAREGSIMSNNGEKYFDVIKASELVEEKFKKADMWEKYKVPVQTLMILNCLMKFDHIQANLKERFYNQIKPLADGLDYKLLEKSASQEFEKKAIERFKMLSKTDYAKFCKMEK